MKQLLRRFTALLMVLAMVMSFAVTAAAAEEDSAEVSTSASEQEADPVIDAEDLLDAETSDADEGSDQSAEESAWAEGSASAEGSEAEGSEAEGSASAEGETPDASASAEADASEDSSAAPEESQVTGEEEETDAQEQTEVEAQEDEASDEAVVEVQAADGMGWRYDGTSFSLYYSDNGTVKAAVGGCFAVPAEEKATLNGTAYTFAPGVYQFDASGALILDTALTGSEQVTALRKDAAAATLTLNKKDTAARTMTVSASGAKLTGTTMSAAATLASGVQNGVLYFEGVAFNGLYRESAAAALQSVKSGVVTPFNGQMAQKEGLQEYLIGTQLQTADKFDKLWYYHGTPYTGYFKASDANNPNITYYIKAGKGGILRGRMVANGQLTTYIEDYVEKPLTDLWYADGEVFTGWYEGGSKVYLIKNGEHVAHPKYPAQLKFFGAMEAYTDTDGTVYNSYAKMGVKQPKLTGLYYEYGVPLTGVPYFPQSTDNQMPKNIYLYKNGKRQKIKDGWYTAPRAKEDFWKPYVYYYFKNNKAKVGGPHKLKAVSGAKDYLSKKSTQKGYTDKHNYYYYFRENGTLVTNLVKYKPGILKSGKFRVHADHTSYTGTILMKNSKTGKFDIPVKSFVVAMSISKSSTASTGTKYGNYPLASGHSTWYHYTSPRNGSQCWYSSSVHIWGSGSMFHSSNYKNFSKKASQKTRLHKMTAHIYNQIGTNVTQHCVRSTTINIRLITAMYKASAKFTNHGRHCTKNVRVYLSKSTKNNFMPFGQMTLLNNVDLNGYILQNANGYGYGKDCAFDPTDHKCLGETIYICNKKTSKKGDCTKVKMTACSQYQLAYALA